MCLRLSSTVQFVTRKRMMPHNVWFAASRNSRTNQIQAMPTEVIMYRRSFARKTHPIIPGEQKREAAIRSVHAMVSCASKRERLYDSCLRFMRSNTYTEHSCYLRIIRLSFFHAYHIAIERYTSVPAECFLVFFFSLFASWWCSRSIAVYNCKYACWKGGKIVTADSHIKMLNRKEWWYFSKFRCFFPHTNPNAMRRWMETFSWNMKMARPYDSPNNQDGIILSIKPTKRRKHKSAYR